MEMMRQTSERGIEMIEEDGKQTLACGTVVGIIQQQDGTDYHVGRCVRRAQHSTT